MIYNLIFNPRHRKLFYFTAFYSCRVRFAPSPTGQLHIGGLKTALINYLFAKSNDGKIIFRLEDTDKSRYDPSSVENILKYMKWLGINFDEGISDGTIHDAYIQSNRLSYYHDAIAKLMASGKAYHCFCSSERLDFLREEQNRRGENPGYDRKCLKLTSKQITEKLQQGSPYAIRLKMADNCHVEFSDVVFGPVSFTHSSVDVDPILLKRDGYPVYHLANVVDDHIMKITHVIRGQEWLVSTPKHIILYHAFGWSQPIFAHLPLIMKEDGHKLSKRNPDFLHSCHNIDNLIKSGYPPETIVSWLMSNGGGLTSKWHPSISMSEIIGKFSLTRITTHNACLSESILHLVGRSFMTSMVLSRRYFDEFISPFLIKYDIEMSYESFEVYFSKLRHRMTCFKDFTQYSYLWLFVPTSVEDLAHLIKEKKSDKTDEEIVKEILERFLTSVNSTSEISDYIDKIHTGVCSKASAFNCLRKALIDRTDGPRISELVSMLGKEEIIRRIDSILHMKDI